MPELTINDCYTVIGEQEVKIRLLVQENQMLANQCDQIIKKYNELLKSQNDLKEPDGKLE